VPEPLWHRGLDPNSGDYVIGADDIHGIDDGYGRMPLIAVSCARVSAVPPLNEPLRIVVPDEADIPENQQAIRDVQTFLEMTVLGTTSQLSAFLGSSIYIGPLRTVPPRGFLYQRAGRLTSWADGLSAWDLLLADQLDLVERTNLWLSRLGAGCQLVVQQLFDRSADAEEISLGHVDKMVRRLLLDTGGGSLVLPSKVGAGISQVIPIIVSALDGRAGLTLVEQPEIHVHPAVQVELGDLLIEAVTREVSRRPMLVETHSEHLILRLLRRIHETTEKKLAEGAPAFAEDQLSVLYVESPPDGVHIRRLRVDKQGEFVDRWPKGFFAERMEELL
jgi:AAA domain, putative AbiEii toxin, Type IV TA system